MLGPRQCFTNNVVSLYNLPYVLIYEVLSEFISAIEQSEHQAGQTVGNKLKKKEIF